MGIENEIVESWWLQCDRCHIETRPSGEEHSLLAACRLEGWSERLDGALRPRKVWLCPSCTAEVRIEQGEA